MTPRPSRILFAACCLAGTLSFSNIRIAAQARDAAPRPTTGTASVTGTVFTNEQDSKPIRRATVSLTPAVPGQFTQRVTVTDDEGRFVFTGLPATSYGAPRAVKPGYVQTVYGEKRTGGIGTPISLAEGQRLTIALRMYRGAVITGTLRDRGRVMPGISVSATPIRTVDGVRTRGTTLGGSATTDDRGTYRIFGLPPGDFAVSAVPRVTSGEVRPVTDAEFQWADRQIQSPSSSGAMGAPTAVPPRPAQAIAYTPVYYPGALDAATAGLVTLAAGEERGGVDFDVAFVSTAKVEGTILDADGKPALNPQLNLISRADAIMVDSFFFLDTMLMGRATIADGKFTFSGVRPGDYTIAARASDRAAPTPSGPGRGGPAALNLWATADVTVNGEDLSGIELRVQQGMELSGRVVFDGSSLPPPTDLSRVSIRLSAAPNASGVTVSVNVPNGQAAADGTFKLEGVTPGRYFLSATVPGAPPAPGAPPGSQWTLRSARVGSVDAADSPFEVQPNQNISNVVFTFTDRVAELTGTLMDEAGKPTPALSIILFPTDRGMWSQRSRRMRLPVRASTDGKFRFTNLQPGEYFLAALSDFESADVFKPEFLDQVAAAAMKITIAEGEKKVQDLKISGGG